jgi:predicted transcriptional regulator
MNAVKRLLWWILAGSAGGLNRGRILEELFKTPHNANELSKVLNLDYKTIRHHLRVLEKNRLVTFTGSGYGKTYFPSDMLEENVEIFREIWERIGENQIKKKDS